MEQIQFIGLTPEELQKQIIEGINDTLNEIKKNLKANNPDDFLTRKETAEMLKVDLSTLHNWVKSKKIIAYGCGGRVYFKRSDIERALVKIN